MSVKPEIIVLDTSVEAASIQTITGWVSRTGQFWGSDERMARYCGSTHHVCDCGEMVEKSGYCRKCADARKLAKYAAMPRASWDGASMLYSEANDEYYHDMQQLEEYYDDNEIAIADMCIVICDPTFATQIEASEHYCDDLPEDGDLPAEIEEAFEALNKIIAACKAPLSWSPGRYALDVSTLAVALVQPQDEEKS